ncbi:MAG: UMP kinase [Phycisphaerales bacterium]
MADSARSGSDGRPKFDRILLKVSGESLAKAGELGIDSDALNHLAREIIDATNAGCEVAVVVGGGNIIRGAALAQDGLIPQASADYMGMLGTIINGVALKEALEHHGKPARLMSAINITAVAEPFIRGRALRHFEKGRVIILAGGTGNPFCTTDTAAALRATELNCAVILKATKVDGVYTADPKKDRSATRYESITFTEALEKQLRIMDLTAFSMCMEQRVPIVVFDFAKSGNIRRAAHGESVGTLIHNA